MKRECTAQLDRFLDTGLVPTHADSHQHMHVLPGIIDIILDLCLDHGIPAVRIPSIPVSLLATHPSNLGEQVGRPGSMCWRNGPGKKARAWASRPRVISGASWPGKPWTKRPCGPSC